MALKDIPAFSRVMVERTHSYKEVKDDPRFADLYPEDEAGFQKFLLNGEIHGCVTDGVGYRSARVNHACDANAFSYYNYKLKATILASSRPIKSGEEISVNYDGSYIRSVIALGPLSLEDPHLNRRFRCPADCLCRDPSLGFSAWKFSSMLNQGRMFRDLGDFKASYDAFKEALAFFDATSFPSGSIFEKLTVLEYAAKSAACIDKPVRNP